VARETYALMNAKHFMQLLFQVVAGKSCANLAHVHVILDMIILENVKLQDVAAESKIEED